MTERRPAEFGPRELDARVERLFHAERLIEARNGLLFKACDIVYLYAEENKTFAVAESGKRFETARSLTYFEKVYDDLFLRVHRSFLVAVDRIEGLFRRYPDEPNQETTPENREIRDMVRSLGIFDEDVPAKALQGGIRGGGSRAGLNVRERGGAGGCELALRGTDKRVPVTETYSRPLMKALGVKSLSHLVPEHPDDKALRQYELIDFGWRELFTLDATDKAAVEAFKKRWDIKQFTRDRMLSYFRQFGVNEINKRRVIKNIIYQLYRWIVKGIEPPSDGNIRSLWYRIKAVLAYHSNVLGPGDVEVFYNTLQEMIEERGLFRYKDFGFMDMNEPYRGIGSKRPEVVLASEKLGHYLFIKKMAVEAGVSFICMKGEPAVISIEYFADDLLKACGGKELTVFCISDIDPAGYSIEGNLVNGLRRNGHGIGRVVKLVDTSVFTSEEIAIVRYPVVSYEAKGAQVKPVGTATMGSVTKARAWFDLVKDDRLISEKDKGGGWKTVTIWGIESDAADREVVRKRFVEGVGKRRVEIDLRNTHKQKAGWGSSRDKRR